MFSRYSAIIFAVMAKDEQSAKTAVANPSSAHVGVLDLSSFELENCTLEVRYPFALAIWDQSGQLWKAIQEKWPDIAPIAVDPRKVDFQTGKTRFTVEFEQARITVVEPEKSLEQFFKDSKEFVRLTTHHMQILTFKRVGFRLLYFKEFKDKIDAAKAFFSLGLIRLPEGKKFEIEEQPLNPNYALRWESEKKGVMLSCRVETRTVDITPPPEAARVMKPIHKETSGVVLDIDYYTVAPVEPGQIDAHEWMKHAMHVIARDSRYLFEG